MVAGVNVAAHHCTVCNSSEVYLSPQRRRQRWLGWLHPGQLLFHCHSCDNTFWEYRGTEEAAPEDDLLHPGEVLPEIREMPQDPVKRSGLHCPGCGTAKNMIGILWDDMWTAFRGHNKLYRCRRCKSMFSPPP